MGSLGFLPLFFDHLANHPGKGLVKELGEGGFDKEFVLPVMGFIFPEGGVKLGTTLVFFLVGHLGGSIAGFLSFFRLRSVSLMVNSHRESALAHSRCVFTSGTTFSPFCVRISLMKLTPIKTPIIKKDDDLWQIIDRAFTSLPEASVVAVTSKIISLCQGQAVPKVGEKYDLVKKEADLYLDRDLSIHRMALAIKNNFLAVNAGIDESNADNHFLLWPKDLQETTNQIWERLKRKFRLSRLGVIVTDTHSFPLRLGVIGTCLTHCGMRALNDRRGEKDLFGREERVTQVNVVEGLAVAAVLVMGEVAEQTPLCLIQGAKMVQFQNRPPTEKELADLRLTMENDIYGPILSAVPWQKGGSGKLLP